MAARLPAPLSRLPEQSGKYAAQKLYRLTFAVPSHVNDHSDQQFEIAFRDTGIVKMQ
jgi:hypothetical protein